MSTCSILNMLDTRHRDITLLTPETILTPNSFVLEPLSVFSNPITEMAVRFRVTGHLQGFTGYHVGLSILLNETFDNKTHD